MRRFIRLLAALFILLIAAGGAPLPKPGPTTVVATAAGTIARAPAPTGVPAEAATAVSPTVSATVAASTPSPPALGTAVTNALATALPPTGTATASPMPSGTPTPRPTDTLAPAATPMPSPSTVPARAPLPAHTPAPALAPLPALHVSGPYIVTADGTRVQFKGVSINTFNNGGQTFAEAKGYMDLAAIWKANLVRFQLNVTSVQPAELSKAIDYAAGQGMYVVITPTGAGNNDFPGPTQQSHDAIVGFAQQFKDKRNVFYGLINEVNNPADDQWYQALKATARDVRAVQPAAILVMSGREWNRDFSILQRDPWPYDNTIFDVHYYALLDDHGQDITGNNMQIGNLLGRYPVLFGESGVPGAQGGRDNPLDAVYIGKVIAFDKQYPLMVHWTAYEMAPGDWKTSLLKSDGKLSRRGDVFWHDIIDFPPTNFNAAGQ
jgi:hypothetical protein